MDVLDWGKTIVIVIWYKAFDFLDYLLVRILGGIIVMLGSFVCASYLKVFPALFVFLYCYNIFSICISDFRRICPLLVLGWRDYIHRDGNMTYFG